MATPRNSTTTNLRAEPGATKGWERSPVNYLKVNVDASSGLVDRYVGLGFIVRDYEGRFVAAKSIKCRGSFGPREAEAIAVKEALSWIKSKGWKQVLVETDCKEVVDSLNSTIMDWSYFNSIIEDCKRLQMLCAGDLNFCFTPRSGNEAAHLLARSSCNDDVSEEEDGQGGRRRRKKKGLTEKIKEKLLPAAAAGNKLHNKNTEHDDDQKMQAPASLYPQGAAGAATVSHSSAPLAGDHHHHEKKSVIERIKEKLPGTHH
ncbi:unnamed protein product [Cuscuta campestris]|uniref:Uncharacterized protein n=1 Tax=Cuscuta campestris TaxID=132261 RepID=A0A484KIR9_9ASTE|nr:unnamed protein product [Cuscuta campestris]